MSPARVVIFCAVLAEARPLIGRLGLRRVESDDEGPAVYQGADVMLIVSGVGPRRASSAASAVLTEALPELAVVTGFAAALSPALGVGDLVIPDEVVDSITGKTHERTAHHGSLGRLVSVDRVLTRPADKAALHDRFGAGAADMESAAVVGVCRGRDVPWLCVRVISDTADQRLPAGLEDIIDEEGSAKPGAAIGYALTHPFDIAALVRLGRGAHRAAETLADAVPGMIRSTQTAGEPGPAGRC